MKQLLQTNDLVLISYLEALLRDAGIESIVLDAHASTVEGQISAIPRRVMVAEEDFDRANEILRGFRQTFEGA